jgi:hypothetical protein
VKRIIRLIIVSAFIPVAAFGQLQFGAPSRPESIKSDNLSGSLVFTQNLGQWGQKTLYKAEAPGVSIYLCNDEIAYKFIRKIDQPSGVAVIDSAIAPDKYGRQQQSVEMILVRAVFMGANLNPEIIPENRLGYNNNYFYGADQNQWRSDVPNYSAVIYRNVWPGIDLRYCGSNRSLKYDFIINPGADLSQIRVRYEGIDNLGVTLGGDLQAQTQFGLVYENIPSIYQDSEAGRIELAGHYYIVEPGVFGFALDDIYDHSRPLTIDPELLYCTYLGGNNIEDGCAMAVDNDGNAIITGFTQSANFPTLNPYDGTANGGKDIYISKFSGNGGQPIYCTYYGGIGDDVSYGLAVDSLGAIYITGYTGSTNFPIANSFDPSYNSEWDAFVAKLSPSGNALIYSTYFGGNAGDYGYAIAVDHSGSAYIAGATGSGNLPLANAYDASQNGQWDGFVSKFSPTGSTLLYSTYLGGINSESVHGLTIDESGSAYLTGSTNSPDFPTQNAFDNTLGGNYGDYDAFVTKLIPAGNALNFSTYLGGFYRDAAWGIALNRDRNAFVVGYTNSSDFPTFHAYDNSLNGDSDIFVTEFTFSGNNLVYSTYIGGSGGDAAYGIAVDGPGNAYITGKTASTNFPRINPFGGGFGGFYDAIAAKLSITGNALSYCTYLGGSHSDGGWAITVSKIGNAYVMGGTESADFPHSNAYDTSYNGAQDVFLAKFSYGQTCGYTPGDINGDGDCVGSDVIYAVRYFKSLGMPPVDSCYLDSTSNYIYTAGDCNADCRFSGSDIMRLVAHFKGIAPIEPCRFFPPEP